MVNLSEHAKGGCRDAENDKLITCALSANADCTATGDKDLSDLRKYQSTKIIDALDFIKMFD